VTITGNNNMSSMTAYPITGNLVTLRFTGTASFNDNLANINLGQFHRNARFDLT
jgi:hypothetical protein